MSKIVFVPKMSGLGCGKHVQVLWNIWVDFSCNVVFFPVSLITAQIRFVYFCIDGFRIWIIDDKSPNVAAVPFFSFVCFFKHHCAVCVQIFKSTMLNVLDSS